MSRIATTVSRRGFTLIELLVVLMVILVLLGLLFPAISMVRNSARRSQTTARLQQVEAAIDQYQTVNRQYPLEWASLAHYDGLGVGDPSNYDAIEFDYEQMNRDLLAALASIDNDTFRSGNDAMVHQGMIVDVWKQPLVYRPYTLYGWKENAAYPDDIDGPEPPGANSYQLWSIGPDGVDQQGREDDLTSWSQ